MTQGSLVRPASARPRSETYLDVFWLIVLGVASSWWCLTAAQNLSATFDEPDYLRWGLEHWRTWKCGTLMKYGAMPLAVDLQTLPLFLWEKWRGFPIDPVRDLWWSLSWARAATLVFWWTLLIYAFRSARALAGAWGGRLAVSLIACEPAFLAHASLATSDLAVTACLLVFFFEFRAHRDRRWPKRVLFPAVLYGVAILAKASALIFGMIGILAIEGERLIASGALRNWRFHPTLFRPFLRDAVWIGVGGLAVMLLYCGSEWETEPTFVRWAQTLIPGRLRDAMLWSAEHLRIFSNGGEGLAQQIKHNLRGHPTYLLGQEYRRSVWFYYPVALTIKTSLPLLLLPAVVGVVRPRALWNWALLAAASLFFFSINCRVQIGIRFMLPLLALLSIGLACAITAAGRSLHGPRRYFFLALLSSGLLWNCVAAVKVWPQALCYTNAAWGGTPKGYRWLSDSNYDWGQGILELRGWQEHNKIAELDIWSFGQDPRSHLPPLRELPLHSNEWMAGRSPAEVVRGRCIAVSTTLLYGAYASGTEASRAAVSFFRTQRPLDRTSTFFIYDFRRSE